MSSENLSILAVCSMWQSLVTGENVYPLTWKITFFPKFKKITFASKYKFAYTDWENFRRDSRIKYF